MSIMNPRLKDVAKAMDVMYPEKPNKPKYVPKWKRDVHRPNRQGNLRMDFARDDAGHPLGKGYPTGRSLRLDGETHRTAWMRILRDDPCAYCGAITSGTVDHIEPRSKPARGHGGSHTWANFTGACDRCNQRKGARTLLIFLAVRRWSFPASE